jgi:hypothetical protein
MQGWLGAGDKNCEGARALLEEVTMGPGMKDNSGARFEDEIDTLFVPPDDEESSESDEQDAGEEGDKKRGE